MKTITIGRGDGVDIFIDDEMISRQHAVLRIYPFGKIELVDMESKNGTFINSVRMNPNIPVRVKRKDVITFAEVSKLDWSKIPDNTKYFKIGAIILGAIIALLILFGIGSFCYNKFFAKEPAKIEYNDGGEAAPVKTEGRIETPDDKAKTEKEKDEEKKDGQKDLSGKKVQELFPSTGGGKDNGKGKGNGNGNGKANGNGNNNGNNNGNDNGNGTGNDHNSGAII